MNTNITRGCKKQIAASVLCAVALSVASAAACEDRFSGGVRGGVQLGNGKPGNDAPGGEIYLRTAWTRNTSLDLYYGLRMLDFELPATRVLGLKTNDRDASGEEADTDSSAQFHVVGARVERSWRPFANGRTSFFGSAALGLAYFKFSGVGGDLVDGGRYRVQSGSGWEVVPSLAAGIRYDVSSHLRLELGVQDDYHFSKVSVSGTTTINGKNQTLSRDIGNYNEIGFFFGVQLKL